MSRETRRRNLESDLATLENRFEQSLRVELRACVDGKWGLFGQNDAVLRTAFGGGADRYVSQSAERLNEMATKIGALRTRLGYTDPNTLCARYAAYRARRDSNAPGEPKLALEFLAELEAADSDRRT